MTVTFGAIKIRDTNYPYLLREIYNSPKELFYRGDLRVLQKTCISIVGTRKNTEYGERMTRSIIENISALDICIVSGLAAGIDTIAHKAALELNLPTIAVLGSGINNIYPKQNQNLAQRIEQNGLILSEYPEETEPINYHFPQRNRIVSGLSVATIVIEAPKRSGALITAKLALDQGRDIFALPGDVDREKSLGAIHLIQHCSAYPICSGFDVIEVLKKQPHLFPSKEQPKKPEIQYNLSPEEKEVLSVISKSRMTKLGQIYRKTNIEIQTLLGILSILEIKGIVLSSSDKYRQKY